MMKDNDRPATDFKLDSQQNVPQVANRNIRVPVGDGRRGLRLRSRRFPFSFRCWPLALIMQRLAQIRPLISLGSRVLLPSRRMP
jgi:hypothetical protein